MSEKTIVELAREALKSLLQSGDEQIKLEAAQTLLRSEGVPA